MAFSNGQENGLKEVSNTYGYTVDFLPSFLIHRGEARNHWLSSHGIVVPRNE